MMLEMIRELTPLNRVFSSRDYDRSIEYVQKMLPFRVLEYGPEDEINGWKIPPRWDVTEARITRGGELVYDGLSHALSVIVLSTSVDKTVTREELREHLFYDHRYADAVPYHFRQQYRSWERDWGFCVPKTLYDALEPGNYHVRIKTDEARGTLKLLEHTHAGRLPQTIVLMSHLDHPGMSNDGVAGCAVGVEVMRRLQARETKLSYTLLLHQEVIGSEYYLGWMEPGDRDRIMEGLFLEMLGSESQLALQNAPGTVTNIETALGNVLEDRSVPHRRGDYGDIVVNGEYIWHGYGIPVASLSRFPYPEYHTDRDNMSIISSEALEQSVDIVMAAIDELESTPVVVKQFTGNICTSNPAYDLYVDPGQPAFGTVASDAQLQKLRALMERIPSLHRPISVRALAAEVGLEESIAGDYLRRWESKGLIELV